jgi:hypothetical protein
MALVNGLYQGHFYMGCLVVLYFLLKGKEFDWSLDIKKKTAAFGHTRSAGCLFRTP